MKYRVYVDESKIRKDGMMPVVLIFEGTGKRFKVATGLFSSQKFKGREFPDTEPNFRAKTMALAKRLLKIDEYLIMAEQEPWVDTQAFVKGVMCGEPRSVKSLAAYMRQYAETKRAEGTRKLYRQTATKIERYDSAATFGSVNLGWIEGFDKWMDEKGAKTTNARGIHLRNLKTLMNWAVDEELTTNMAYRKYKVRKERVVINSVSLEQIRALRDCNVNRGNEVYRDMFMLTFYLAGINPVDLFNLTQENVRNGKLVYRRQKTGGIIEVPINEEARRIFEAYKGERHLLWIVEREKDYLAFTSKLDRQLKGIAPVSMGVSSIGRRVKIKGEAIMPNATVYSARYTFACIGAELEIPRETIALCLGHSWADVTSHYIAYNQKRVDDAVKRIVDYVNEDLRERERERS